MRGYIGRVVCYGLAGALLIGCGGGAKPAKGPTGKVIGTVTCDGQPVTVGTVRLYSPKTAESGAGPIADGGKFTLAQPLLVGTYTATISPPQEPPPEAGKPYEPKSYENIPLKYRTESTSDLVVEIKAGENSVTVDMKKS